MRKINRRSAEKSIAVIIDGKDEKGHHQARPASESTSSVSPSTRKIFVKEISVQESSSRIR